MKEYILSALYELFTPWSCDASNTHAYVHPSNVVAARNHLKSRGFNVIVVGKALNSFPSRFSL